MWTMRCDWRCSCEAVSRTETSEVAAHRRSSLVVCPTSPHSTRADSSHSCTLQPVRAVWVYCTCGPGRGEPRLRTVPSYSHSTLQPTPAIRPLPSSHHLPPQRPPPSSRSPTLHSSLCVRWLPYCCSRQCWAECGRDVCSLVRRMRYVSVRQASGSGHTLYHHSKHDWTCHNHPISGHLCYGDRATTRLSRCVQSVSKCLILCGFSLPFRRRAAILV